MIIDIDQEIALAEALEKKHQWRRAARQWLTVFDASQHAAQRRIVSMRRSRCLSYANGTSRQYSGMRVMAIAGGVLND